MNACGNSRLTNHLPNNSSNKCKLLRVVKGKVRFRHNLESYTHQYHKFPTMPSTHRNCTCLLETELPSQNLRTFAAHGRLLLVRQQTRLVLQSARRHQLPIHARYLPQGKFYLQRHHHHQKKRRHKRTHTCKYKADPLLWHYAGKRTASFGTSLQYMQ